MKIIVLHGDDTEKSYDKLQKYIAACRKKGWDVVKVYDKSQNLKELFVAQGLFAKEKVVVVENASLFPQSDAAWLKKHGDLNINLIIFHPSEVTKTFLKSLPKIEKVEEFKLPKLLWGFLESIYPGNAKNVLLIFHKVIEKDPPELVFTMIARHVKDLFWAKVEASGMPYQSWRVQKLKTQANKFSEEKLAGFIDALAEADIKSKTSNEKLPDLLDFIFATHLE